MLKRRTPLKRTPMKRGTSELKRTPIRQRSAKRETHMRTERRPLVERLVAEGVTCKVGPVLESVGLHPGCTGEIGGMHERRKSSAAGSRVNPRNLIPACNTCNGYIEDHAGEVRELTGSLLVVREGDEEYEALSKRNDR